VITTGPFRRTKKSGQTARERQMMRRHLIALDERRESSLRDLGGLALEMFRRDNVNERLLWNKAAEVAAVDDEIRLIKRGLEERRTVEELDQMAREAALETHETSEFPALGGEAPIEADLEKYEP
jgi:hypothetical protein